MFFNSPFLCIAMHKLKHPFIRQLQDLYLFPMKTYQCIPVQVTIAVILTSTQLSSNRVDYPGEGGKAELGRGEWRVGDTGEGVMGRQGWGRMEVKERVFIRI